MVMCVMSAVPETNVIIRALGFLAGFREKGWTLIPVTKIMFSSHKDLC